MGIRKDFLMHRRKTVESFRYVRGDISAISTSINNLKDLVSSIESRISVIDSEMPELRKSIEKNTAETAMQHNQSLSIQSKIEQISKSISNALDAIASVRNGVNSILSSQQRISNSISSHQKSISKIVADFKNQSLKNKQVNSSLKKTKDGIKKLKNLLHRRVKSQQKKISELSARIKARKSKKPARIVKKKITPRKTIKKTITPKRIVTETTTPKKKTITEIVQK